MCIFLENDLVQSIGKMLPKLPVIVHHILETTKNKIKILDATKHNLVDSSLRKTFLKELHSYLYIRIFIFSVDITKVKSL